ncbi:hypothetical protein [Streptomyces sp. NPDC050485]|uniref:hypothetical protein n=1 Tax=Streptomyces sp. NPDC050485 TaxID=3365617 RepID=UPI0037A6460F
MPSTPMPASAVLIAALAEYGIAAIVEQHEGGNTAVVYRSPDTEAYFAEMDTPGTWSATHPATEHRQWYGAFRYRARTAELLHHAHQKSCAVDSRFAASVLADYLTNPTR